MKTTLTLLALLCAGVINLSAQTDNTPTVNEEAWKALVELKKDEATKSPEALVIKDAMIAASSMKVNELRIVQNIIRDTAGFDAARTNMRSLAASAKTGDGITAAKAFVKGFDKDMTGWTPELLAAKPSVASNLAMLPTATTAFKTAVWTVLQTQSAHESRKFWKQYRSTLPKAEQIAVTELQKAFVIALPTRDDNADAWLAEVSADLIALQLDAPPQ